MTETKPNQLSLLSYREIAIPQQQITNELDSSLQKVITAEVNKYSTKMTEVTVDFFNNRISHWENHMETVEQELRNAESLVICHRNANYNLREKLVECTAKIENQRKTIAKQQNVLTKKTKRIESLEYSLKSTDKALKESNKKIICYEERLHINDLRLKSLEKNNADLKLKIVWCKSENDRLIRDYEERLKDLSKTRDYYYSSFRTPLVHDRNIGVG